MTVVASWLHGRLEARSARRVGVPDEATVPQTALGWAAIAAGIALGAAISGPNRLAVLVLLVAVAATRPSRATWRRGGRNVWRWPADAASVVAAVHGHRRAGLWLLVAAAVSVGGLRAAAIDRSARPLQEAAITGVAATLTEALEPAAPGGRSPSVIAEVGSRRVQLVAPKFGGAVPALERGEVATVTGRMVSLGGRPGDARLRRQGVAGRLLATSIASSGARRGGVLGAIDRFAEAAQQQLVATLGQRRGALVAGMALGTAEGIGDADADALRTSGLWHLVAASGGNIALVVALVMALGWAVGAGDRTRLVAAAVAVCLYVPLAGSGPSIQRAGVMGLAGLLALALGREHRGANALALAAAATLLVDPRSWLDVGWQLSFAAAAGLIAVGPAAARRLAGFGVPRWLAAGLACTVVATVATAPIMLATFGELSLIGLVANAIVLPLVGVAVWSGALAAVLTPLAPAAAALVAQPAGAAAGVTLSVATWAGSRTHAVASLPEVLAIVAGLALVAVVRPPPVVVGGLAVVAVAVLIWSVPRPPGEPRLVVLDIGQGNATLLQDGSDGILIDAGPVDGGLVAKLRRTGVTRLRAVILSHPAADHDGGAAAVIAAFPTDLVLDGGEPGGGPTHDAAVRAARTRRTPVVLARAGQRLVFGRVSLRLRWPTPAAARKPGDPNDRAAVVEAQVGKLRVLLPADAEGGVLGTLPNLLPADVLVVSHHGSTDDSLPATLKRLEPQLAIISVGKRNTYGHPTRQALGALRAAKTPTLRTDQAGTIDVRARADGRVLVRTGG